MMKMKKFIKRFLIVLLLTLCLGVSFNVSAARGQGGGYMYDSKGQLIESSVGYTVTEENIFNILSDSWKEGFEKDGTIFISFDDDRSIIAKCKYVFEKKLAGIMYWENGCGPTGDLVKAIKEGMKK